MGTTRMNEHCYFSFLLYPYNLRVCIVLMLVNTWKYMVGLVSSSSISYDGSNFLSYSFS